MAKRRGFLPVYKIERVAKMSVKRAFFSVFQKIMVICVAMTGVFYTARADEITCPAGQILHTYESVAAADVPAGVQNGTPTPTNPIEPTFYQQGNMVLRKVGDVADSYDAATGKITRRVGVKVLNGTEEGLRQHDAINGFYIIFDDMQNQTNGIGLSSHGQRVTNINNLGVRFGSGNNKYIYFTQFQTALNITTLGEFRQFLAQQYSAGTPVTIYYPLAEAVEEDWTGGTTYCADTIKIATTAYNSARFSPVVNDLNSTVATIRDIVTKTINQTAAIASLQADKQTRPEEQCPAGKKCLLVETEENGVIVPHWYEIIENVYGLPSGYTQVDYVTNTAQTMINTGVRFDFSKNYEIELKASGVTGSWYILQAREFSGAPISGVSGSMTGNKIGLNFNGTYIQASETSRVIGHIYYIKGTINNGNLTLYVKDETAGTEETATGTYTVTTGQSVDTGLFGNTGGNYVAIDSNVYFARIKEDGNYIMDYVPCKQGTTAGFYDKVSNTFKTATGLSAGPVVQ